MSDFYVYPKSVRPHGCGKAYMLRDNQGKDWVVSCGVTRPLDHQTADFLRTEFPWTAPSRVLGLKKTIGLGDRLGLAGSGQLAALEGSDAVPVLAQQSSLELALSRRSPEEVLDAATFAAFREGYVHPWGADADRLQSFSQIEAALAAGYTMLTLDLRPLLGQGEAPDAELREFYLGRTFSVEGHAIPFDRLALEDCCRQYGQAIELAAEVYQSYVLCGNVDLELALDADAVTTTPAGHYFVATELRRRGVVFQALAPALSDPLRPCLDWQGEQKQLAQELTLHSAIARSFGYKLSFHCASHKPALYPLLAQHCKGVLHLKTSGLSWLEAMKLLARHDPSLFRIAQGLALTAYPTARQLEPLEADPARLPALDSLPDKQLPLLFSDPNLRQLLYCGYGPLLHSPIRERLYTFWQRHETDYAELLSAALKGILDGLR